MNAYVVMLEKEVDRITGEWIKGMNESSLLRSQLDGLRSALMLSMQTADIAIGHVEKVKLELDATKAALQTLQSKL